MVSAAKPNWNEIVRAGAAAGVAGGVLLDLFLYVVTVLPQHASMLTAWQFIASTAVGKVAYTASSYAWLGLAMHFAVSIAWGVGYAYIAATRIEINRLWVISGLVFGVVVYVVMQLVLVGDNNFHKPSITEFSTAVVAHCFFFGLPVAFVTRSLMR